MKTTIAIVALTLAATFLSLGCGGSSSSLSGGSGANKTEYVGTQAPGDVWAWTFDDRAFTGLNETWGFDYAGTASHLPSGFIKLTIASTTDPGVAVGDSAYAVEIPGTCVLVKPAGGNAVEPIFGTGLGANPTEAAFTMNWVAVPHRDYRLDQDDAYGVAAFTRTDTGYDLAIEFAQLAWDTMEPGSRGRLVERDGRYVVDDDPMVFGIQASDVFFGDHGPGEGGLVGFRQPTNAIPWADVSSRTYIGMLVRDGQTDLVRVEPGDGDTLIGRSFGSDANVEADTLDPDDTGVTLRLASTPAPGLFRVTLESGGPAENLVAIVAEVEGRKILFCLGGTPGVDGEEQAMYNVMLIERR